MTPVPLILLVSLCLMDTVLGLARWTHWTVGEKWDCFFRIGDAAAVVGAEGTFAAASAMRDFHSLFQDARQSRMTSTGGISMLARRGFGSPPIASVRGAPGASPGSPGRCPVARMRFWTAGVLRSLKATPAASRCSGVTHSRWITAPVMLSRIVPLAG